MQESFLHYVWTTGLFRATDLKTTDGAEITIVKKGYPNVDGGPDFNQAQIKIAGQHWVGNVEIHVKSGEWFDHGHQNDKAYDSTILHVCFTHNADVFRTDGSPIPCLELDNLIHPNVFHRYDDLQQSGSEIPCAQMIHEVPKSIKILTLEQMMAHRFELKTKLVLEEAKNLSFNWNELLYRQLCQAYGLRINKEPFAMLAKILSFALVVRYGNKPLQLEALIFGTAGFLSVSEQGKTGHEAALITEFKFLQQKHQLEVLPKHIWKFLRLRPANFPTIRLAQLSAFLQHSEHLLSMLLDANKVNDLYDILACNVSDYWLTHYRIGEASQHRSKLLGKSSMDIIIINAFVPVLFAYAHWRNDSEISNKAINLLEQLKLENNKITRMLEPFGFEMKHASNSQGAIHLVKNFCTFKRCLQCPIGHHLLNRSAV